MPKMATNCEMKLKLIFAFLYILSNCYDTLASPILIIPKEFRVNVDEKLIVLSRDNEPVTIEITDFTSKKNIIFRETFLLSKYNDPLQVSIRISSTQLSPSASKVTLSVIDKDGHKSESIVKVIPKNGYAFVQTDKPIYTPKDVVRIRMIRLDENLRPLKEKIKLRIKNSQKITVEEKTFFPKGSLHFIDHNFEFPPAPKLGVWNAEVYYGPDFAANYSVTFEVREYVLPTFSIKLKSPKIITPSTPNLNGSVEVRYVYGKPVEGSVTFKYGVKEPNGRVTFVGRSDVKTLSNGSTSYIFSTNQFRQFAAITWFPAINGHRFVVEANVNEKVTGKKEKAVDDSGLFVNSPYVISFKNAFSDFKPDIETFVSGQVLDVFGDPVSDITVSLHLVDERGVPIIPKYISPNMNSSRMQTDSFGMVYLPVTLKKGVERLHVTLRTLDPRYNREEQAEAVHILFAHKSESESYISIVNRAQQSTKLMVGDLYQSLLIVRGTIIAEKMFQLIISRGRIISAEQIPADGRLQIKVTREMTPGFRVIVIALTRDDDAVSDSIKFDVSDGKCDFEISAKREDEDGKFLPGSQVSLLINGNIGDSVALLGVDEAVYVLRNKDKLTKTRVAKEVEKSDVGCGPGGGVNLEEVVDHTGLKLIWRKQEDKTDENVVNTCHRTVRVKRDASYVANQYEGRAKKCCVLGMMPSTRPRSCQHKANILKEHLPKEKECYDAFLYCCKAAAKPNVQQSAPVSSANIPLIDRTRIGSPTEEYVHVAYEEEMESKAFIRKDFRETWLFDLFLLNKSLTEYPVVLPHSITTWSVTGMSLSQQNGLCMIDSPIRMISFQPIFLQISMPYTVVQNEQIEILATIFNYGSNRANILLYTYGVEHVCSEAKEPGEKSTRKHIAVAANSAESVGFPIVPLKAGKYQFKVVALWSGGTDIVVKTLNVIPPGVTVEDDFSFQLDPLNRQRRQKRSISNSRLKDVIDAEHATQTTSVNLIPTRNIEIIVPQTQECIVQAIADQFGATVHTTLNDLDQLIRQPKGCGEQTMFLMAPTLFTLNYLDSIGRLNGDLKHRGLKYLKEGYKSELSFRKDDGSFSAFPIRPSSVWLTAFVMKVFCQARSYLYDDGFDDRVIEEGILWLLDKQKADGSWEEQNPVVHQMALGGVQGSLPLTAYILISFHECGKIYPFSSFNSTFLRAINKSESYLIKNQEKLGERLDTYSMALTAYSLTFTEPRNSLRLVSMLNNYSNHDLQLNTKYWRNSFEVEATSYALMAILKSGLQRNSLDALSVANWLNSRKSFSGSFDTTQDTIVALEALAQFAKSQSAIPDDAKLICNITTNKSHQKRSLEFHKDNALVLQKFKVQSGNDALEFHTHGNGIGLMSIKLKYNILESPDLCKFDIELKVSEWKEISSRYPSDDDEDSAEDFFNDFPDDLMDELEARKKRKTRSLFNSFGDSSFKQSLDRIRNSIANFGLRNGTRNILSSFGSTYTNRGTMPSGGDLNLSGYGSNLMRDYQYQKNNLSKNKISQAGASKLVLLLEICVRHLARHNSEMSIIDVGILSGYKAHKEDLEEILKSTDSLVSKYEQSDRNIVFYLDTVPFGRPYCIQFRLIREHIVANQQAAIITVYDYYQSDHSCTQLYSPTRISALIDVKCDSDVCECAKGKNCPNDASQLVKIGSIHERKPIRARELFEELVCSEKFNYVFEGQFVQINSSKNGFKLLQFKVERSYRGDALKGETVWLSLNKECQETSIEAHRGAIIFGQKNDHSRHLSGSSILYYFGGESREDSAHKNVESLRLWLEHKVLRDNWKCANDRQEA